jgi:hypothetical protein
MVTINGIWLSELNLAVEDMPQTGSSSFKQWLREAIIQTDAAMGVGNE